MEEKKKIIRIKAGMSDPTGKLIPRGMHEQVTVDISDEAAVWYFKNRRTTENFARVEIEGDKANGIKPRTVFVERLGKALRSYPGMSKEEIRDSVLQDFKELNLNAKVYKDGK